MLLIHPMILGSVAQTPRRTPALSAPNCKPRLNLRFALCLSTAWTASVGDVSRYKDIKCGKQRAHLMCALCAPKLKNNSKTGKSFSQTKTSARPCNIPVGCLWISAILLRNCMIVGRISAILLNLHDFIRICLMIVLSIIIFFEGFLSFKHEFT